MERNELQRRRLAREQSLNLHPANSLYDDTPECRICGRPMTAEQIADDEQSHLDLYVGRVHVDCCPTCHPPRKADR